MSANNLISKAERQFATIQGDLGACEQLLPATAEGGGGANQKLNEASAGLATVMLTIKSLEDAMLRETAAEKRSVLKERLKGFKADYEASKGRLEACKAQWRELERSRTRTALFATPSQSAASALTEEALAEREDATLGYAESRINDYVTIGTGTLDSLRTQRAMLKSTQRRLLDAGTRLGLSQSVMRVISRRTAQDRYIFYTGVIVVFIVIYLCWRYL